MEHRSGPKNVLLIGLHPDSVDFRKWPELSPEKLRAAFRETLALLEKEGHAARWCLVDSGANAVAQVNEALGEQGADVVVIGAGVRVDPDHLLLFERIVNAVHESSPASRIAFNTRCGKSFSKNGYTAGTCCCQ